MATYVLIHGSGDSAFYWHLLIPELRARGHDVVATDLPCDDAAAGLSAYADAVVSAIGDRTELVVVAQSFGAFTAPLVCERVPVELMVLVAGMPPRPGERGEDWSSGTGFDKVARVAAGDEATFYHDVPPALAAEAMRHGRVQSATPGLEPWPLDAWPAVPTKYVLCRDDRLFPADWLRGVVRERLNIVPDEIDGGHCTALARPRELADRLEVYRVEPHRVRYAHAFDAEAPAHDERLHAAAGIQPGEHVLDIGCGTGHSTRTAARVASPGHVLGVDISAPLLEHARATTPLDNVTYEQGDAQIHPFLGDHFDVAISRFGAMFFTDPSAAFTNIARALRPGGRLALLVLQRRELNEWAVAIGNALGSKPPATPTTLDAFSLGDAAATRQLLARAGFDDIQFADVHEPVFYGRDIAAALVFVRGFLSTRDARGVEQPLRAMLAGHQRESGVFLDSRAWIITASRPRSPPLPARSP